jgi:hypothetical protein
MLYHTANYLCLVSGLVLFGLGSYGLMGVPKSDIRTITLLLEPLGYSELLDNAYLVFLAIIGFWLTLRMNVRIPAALGLGLVLGKMLFLNLTGFLSGSLAVALSLILFGTLLRLITSHREDENDFHSDKVDPW